MNGPATIPAPSAEASRGLSPAARIGRNVSLRLASQAVAALINLAAMVLLGRTLSAHGYGEYAFYYSLIPLIGSAGDAGVGIIVTREIARDRARGPLLLADAILVKAGLGLVLVTALASAWRIFDPARAALVSLLAVTALVDVNQDPSIWTLRAHERLDVEALLLIVSQVVWFAVLAAGVWLHAGLPALLAAATVAFAVRLVVGAAIVVRRLYRPRFRPDRARLMGLLARGLPFGAAMAAVVLYGRVGVLVLGAFATAADVACFNVGYLLSQPFGFVASAVTLGAFPRLARGARGAPDGLRSDLRRTYRYVLVAAFPLTIGLALLAPALIEMLFHGRGFERSALALRGLSPALPLIFLNLASRYALAALDRQERYLRGVFAGLVVNAGLCAALVPLRGFMGACIAYVAAELTIWLVCQHALAHLVAPAELARDAAKPLLAAAGMGTLMLALHGAPPLFAVAAGCVAYPVLLRLLCGISDEELQLLRRIPATLALAGPYASHLERRP
jgi:O-antigen/teichoic acid export membrane protein